jgi:hypothetical protein
MQDFFTIRVKLSVAALLLVILPDTVVAAGRSAMAVHTKLAARFTQAVDLPLTATSSTVDRVVYGNRQYGYFETDNFQIDGKRIRITLIPPGFKFPIEFHVRMRLPAGDRSSLIGKQTFKSPLPAAYTGVQIKTKGVFSENFYLISAALPKSSLSNYDAIPVRPDLPMKNKSRFTFLIIVNRFGEIVWAYVPHRGDEYFNSYIYGRPLGGGEYGIVMGKKDGYFAVVNFEGKKLHEVDLKHAAEGDKYPMHHDFDLGPDNELYTITNNTYFSKKERKSYLTNMILKVDLRTKKPEIVKDLLEVYHPDSTLHWSEHSEKDQFVTWGGEPADHDFTHANSIRFVDGKGVLLSLRHLDTIVMLDQDFKEVEWTIGRTARDTYQVVGPTAFSHQHAPVFVGDNRLLLFDNGFEQRESRVIELGLDPSSKKVSLEWEFKAKPSLYSSNRSAATKLSNGNILALFVDPVIGGGKKPQNSRVDIMLEIDRESRRDIAAMRFFYFAVSPGYRAEPVATIGLEKYLGRNF